MSIFDACKSAATRLNSSSPTSFFGNPDKFASEIADLANETAIDVAKGHDWQALKVEGSLTGDGIKTEFDLPSDFDRLSQDVEMWAVWLDRPLCRVRNDNDWFNPVQLSYSWGLIGGKIRFATPIPNASVVKFFYQTRNLFADTSGNAKPVATVDSDAIRVPERVITLGLIWRWRQMKRLEYSEDMTTAEIALTRAIAHDKTFGVIRPGGVPVYDAQLAYDGVITP